MANESIALVGLVAVADVAVFLGCRNADLFS